VSAPGVVLVADDDPSVRALLHELLTRDGYRVDAVGDGESVLAALEQSPDVILLDVRLPGPDGLAVCREIKSNPATRLTPVIILTGLPERDYRISAINVGADDFLTKPFDVEELRARVRSLIRFKRYTDELESAESVILRLALVVEARDTYTSGHCERLARYATAMGRHLRLSEDDIAALFRGAYLHDVGKIGVPDAVLRKAGPLTVEETAVMRQHPIIGERLCGELRSLAKVRGIVRHHHEYLDGSGYPDGLGGAAVPLLAQIVSLVDAFDAMTTSRPYRAALSVEQAVHQLDREVEQGRRSRDLVDALVRLEEVGFVLP
jgi:putative two-component system response regulator